MRRIIGFIMAVLIFSSCLCSCDKDTRTAQGILERILENEKKLPDGQAYLAGAFSGDKEYFSEEMISSMYGVKAKKEFFSLVEDYAVYISSFANAFEVAVFKCYSKSDVDSICEMCFLRGDTIKSVIGHQKRFENIKVNVIFCNRYVCMYVGEYPDEAEKAFLNAVK